MRKQVRFTKLDHVATHLRRLLLPVACLLIASCDSATPEPAETRLRIETDRHSYRISEDQTVTVSIENQSEHPVFILMPSFWMLLEIREDDVWHELGPWYHIPGGGLWTITVEPDEEIPPLAFHLRYLDDLETGPGTYRFKYELYGDQEFEAFLPLDKRVSNTFIVTD